MVRSDTSARFNNPPYCGLSDGFVVVGGAVDGDVVVVVVGCEVVVVAVGAVAVAHDIASSETASRQLAGIHNNLLFKCNPPFYRSVCIMSRA